MAEELLMTTYTAAVRMGVSVKTVTDLCRAGKIPARKIGRRWYISPAKLVAFVEGADLD